MQKMVRPAVHLGWPYTNFAYRDILLTTTRKINVYLEWKYSYNPDTAASFLWSGQPLLGVVRVKRRSISNILKREKTNYSYFNIRAEAIILIFQILWFDLCILTLMCLHAGTTSPHNSTIAINVGNVDVLGFLKLFF